MGGALQRVRRQTFKTVFGHQEGLFKLRRQGSVSGNGRPLIIQNDQLMPPQIDHRLYGEDHTRHQLHAFAPIAEVGDLGGFMKIESHTVPNKFPHYRASLALCMSLNGPTDISHRIARLDHLHSGFEALSGNLDDFDGIFSRGADEEGFIGVGIIAIEYRGDVDVGNIAVFEHTVSGNAMTNDLVDRNTDAFGESPVVQRRWRGTVFNGKLMDQ